MYYHLYDIKRDDYIKGEVNYDSEQEARARVEDVKKNLGHDSVEVYGGEFVTARKYFIY